MTEFWTKWEGHVINGVFPLRCFLSASTHSAVFLTGGESSGIADAAIKLIADEPERAEAQLSRWRSAAALSHPHVLRILDSGRCELGPHRLLFVAMEYAEQTLAEVLGRRALSPDELQEMLGPVLEALAFLHHRGWVHGSLRPSNILVVQDQVKLAGDTLRRAGERGVAAEPSAYDPPEAVTGTATPAGDLYGLGMTIVAALTRRLPGSSDEDAAAMLPAGLPAALSATVRRCLGRDAGARPSSAEFEALLKGPPAVAVPVAPVPVAAEDVPAAAPRESSRGTGAAHRAGLRIPSAAATAGILLTGLAVGIAVHYGGRPAAAGLPAPAGAASSPAAALTDAPVAAAAGVNVPAPMIGVSMAPMRTSSVVHEEIPTALRSALGSIHGRVRVTVRVRVDSSGKVVGASLLNPSSSRYFARLAQEASGKWKFSPAGDERSRTWLLRFEFTRGGTTARASLPSG